MNSIKMTLTTCLILSIYSIYGQQTKSLYVEGLGSGMFYSVNSDFRFTKTTAFGARIGGALYPQNTFFMPVQINYLFGKGKHKIEIGGGVTVNFGDDIQLAQNVSLMYRFQAENGLLFRAGWSPIFIQSNESNSYDDIRKIFWIWPGLSIGYSFL